MVIYCPVWSLFFLLLQARCAWSPATSQGHIIDGWAQSWGDQGKHGGQKLSPDCTRRGSYHAWRSATETVTYQCTHMYLFQKAGFKLKALACILALMCIVKPEGPPQLCKTDEIGEIVINSRAGGTLYYGLPGVTKNTFEVCQSLKFI